ncbi:Hypothetical predicted protein [Mytilus galloprovincialis]|uniref:Uncharacterized protein n=1 Tax=Mytilus galloprovincialis TaxID=29158 RepID=A0A8B6BQY1_MYTGA|nr:Hypothetical predicted protein [Mytilus galloprovincialis]
MEESGILKRKSCQIKPRNADEIEIIRHPANGKKWIEDINFNYKTQDGQSLITIPFNMFPDDTSTHKSRRWMPLHCIQMQLSGIPIDMRQKQETIQFLGATEKADIMDVAKDNYR